MNDRQQAAEARSKHVARLLDTALIPEFPPGIGLVLLALDIASGEGASMASNLKPEAVIAVCDQTADFLAERLGLGHGDDDDIRIGDVVEACEDCGHVLRSGAQVYERAVVISVAPLMVVSEDASMLWSTTLDGLHLKFVAPADPWTLKKCLTRLPRKPK